MKTNLFFFILLGICLSSCRQSSRDSDNRYSEDRELSGISRLKISGIFNLQLTQSDSESITLDGNPDMAENLMVTQEGDLLILELKEFNSGIFDKKELRVNLSISDLREFEFEGVGNIKTTNTFQTDRINILGEGVGNLNLDLEAREIDAELNMMGNMVLKGKADKVYLKNEGIGNVDASKLISQDLELVSSGIGKVSVHSEGNLSLEVNGIGKVNYTGSPNIIKKEINGIGKVEGN
jgi:hypothetical protein